MLNEEYEKSADICRLSVLQFCRLQARRQRVPLAIVKIKPFPVRWKRNDDSSNAANSCHPFVTFRNNVNESVNLVVYANRNF